MKIFLSDLTETLTMSWLSVDLFIIVLLSADVTSYLASVPFSDISYIS